MSEEYSIFKQPLDKRKKKDIRRHDQHIQSLATLQPGGRVLVKKEERRKNCEITASAMADQAVTSRIFLIM